MSRQNKSILINEHALNREPVPLTRTQNAPVANKFYKGALTIINLLAIFAGVALKLENGGPTFSSISPSIHTILGNRRKGNSFNF